MNGIKQVSFSPAPQISEYQQPQIAIKTRTDEQKQNMQDKAIKYILTAMNAFQHVLIYRVTPKFTLLKAKCRSITRHIDSRI